MKKVVILILCILVFVSGSRGKVYAQEDETAKDEKINFTLYAKSAVLMDADSGRVLFEKNGYEHMPNASTTKIMTCILAIESGTLEETVTVSSYAASMPKVRLGMNQGDNFRMEDLIYSLMLESHNDSAVAIAEHVGGTVEGFAGMMNKKAKELGCEDTYFITPNGLDGEDENGVHGTTAKDLSLIMSYCIKNEAFLKITQTSAYSFSNIGGTRSYSCNNHNAFLGMMEGALSGKTGFTGNAGYCYVGALKRGDRTFIVSLLACGWPNNKTYKWADTKQLMAYGLENYQYEDVFEYEKKLDEIQVEHGVPSSGKLNEETTLQPIIEESTLNLLKKKSEAVRVVYDIPNTLEAPVKEGAQIGNVTYYLDEKLIETYPILAGESIVKLHIAWYLNYLLERFLMVKSL